MNIIFEKQLNSILDKIENHKRNSVYSNITKPLLYSQYCPKISNPSDVFIHKNSDLFSYNYKTCGKDNLSPSEKAILHLLKNDSSIIVKPADKGSIIVIQNRSDYEFEVLRQLLNTSFYKQLDNPMFPATAKMITAQSYVQ